MGIFGAEPASVPSRAQDLAGDPESPYWAQACAWVPGTGHCRDRDCGDACVFRDQREAEARRIVRWRRVRRIFARRQVR